MQHCSIKWNYSSNKAGVFLYKSSSRVQKHSWHCIIGFLVNAALLHVYFILRCYFFFQKKICFFEVYISVNTIFECLPSGHPKCEQLRRGRGNVTAHVYVRLYTISFHGVSPLISSIVLARKNSFSFKSNYIQALK